MAAGRRHPLRRRRHGRHDRRGRAGRARSCSGRASRCCSSRTRSTTRTARTTCGRSSSSGSATRIAVSAIHGRGSGDLLDALVDVLPPEPAGRGGRGRRHVLDRDRRPAERGQVDAVQPAGRRRPLGRARHARARPDGHDRHDRRDRRRPAAVRRHRRACGARARSRSTTEYSSVVRALNAVDQADAALLVIDAIAGRRPPGPAAGRAHRRRRHRGRDRAQQVGPRRRPSSASRCSIDVADRLSFLGVRAGRSSSPRSRGRTCATCSRRCARPRRRTTRGSRPAR